HQAESQCQQAQGDELWPDEGASTATARRGPGTAGPGRGSGRRRRRALRGRSAGRRVTGRAAAARDPAEEDSGGATGAGGGERQSLEKAGKPRAQVQQAKPADKDQYNFT